MEGQKVHGTVGSPRVDLRTPRPTLGSAPLERSRKIELPAPVSAQRDLNATGPTWSVLHEAAIAGLVRSRAPQCTKCACINPGGSSLDQPPHLLWTLTPRTGRHCHMLRSSLLNSEIFYHDTLFGNVTCLAVLSRS